MPCNPNMGAVDIDVDNGDFITVRASGTNGGGIPKFSMAGRDPNGDIYVLLHDGAERPWTRRFPAEGETVTVGKYKLGFAATFLTCARYQLHITYHAGGASTGIVIKDCSWDETQGDREPRTALTVKMI